VVYRRTGGGQAKLQAELTGDGAPQLPRRTRKKTELTRADEPIEQLMIAVVELGTSCTGNFALVES